MAEMTPLQLVSQLRDEFETTLAECIDQTLRKSELNTRIRDARDRLRATLEPDSRAFRVFDRLNTDIGNHHVTIDDDAPKPYTESRDCTFAQKWLNLLNAVMDELAPSTSSIRQGHQYVLPAGDAYEATRKVLRVLKLGQRTVDIVDPYLDDIVFDLLDALDQHVAVRMLTGQPAKPVFVRLLTLLKPKRTNVEARSTSAFHDRFIIVDGTEMWHVGASLNGLGKATSMMSRVTEDPERVRIIHDFEAAWVNGVPLGA